MQSVQLRVIEAAAAAMATMVATTATATKEHEFTRKTFNIFIEWIVETQNHKYLAVCAMLTRAKEAGVSESVRRERE